MRSMSATLSTGFVGDSNTTSRVGRDSSSALEPVEVLDREHRAGHAEAPQHAADQRARRLVHLGEIDDVVARS